MAGTSVASGSNLALTQYSTAVTAQIVRAPGNLNAMTGPAPKQSSAEANMKQQSSADMPYVRITDLTTDPKGDKITVDAFNVVGGKPIMGDRNAEGMGKPLSSSSFDMKIDLATFNVDAGGKMSRQRTRHELRSIAKAAVAGYFPRLIWQRAMAHQAGARGLQVGSSWDLPLNSDVDFDDIMINPLKAPTFNRHLVLNGTGFTRGGQQLATIASTDKWKLSNLDNLALWLESLDTKVPSPKFTGDEQATDAPLKGVLMLSPGMYNDLITDMTSGNNLRSFQSLVEQRQKYAKDSAIFRGECGIWRGILVKKVDHTIFHNASSVVKHVSAANRLTGTETDVTVNAAIGATNQVERAVLLGAQSLARAEGSSNSGVQAAIIENSYNAGRNFEYLGEFMGGEAKFRLKYANENGDPEPTENIVVIDACSPKVGA
jgi:hypothetical protein